jgi:nucleotide-binding universal stress UspA family protein
MDRILLTLDGSRRSESTIPPAAALCRAFGSELVLLRTLHVDESRPLECRIAAAEARSYLKRLLRWADLDGLSVRHAVTVGDPLDETLRLARKLNADLIVVHCACSSPVHCRLDGHVYSIASATSASLLIVRNGDGVPPLVGEAPAGTQGRTSPWPRRILVPVDGSPRGDWAACMASRLAESSGSEVILAHVISAPDLLSPHRHPEGPALLSSLVDHTVGLAQEHLDGMRDRLSGGQYPIRTRVTVARNVPRALDEMAREENADLTALSAHGWFPEADWVHGSVTEALMTHGSNTLLIFQDWPRDVGREQADEALQSRPSRLTELVVPPSQSSKPLPPSTTNRPSRWRRR